MAVMDDLRYVVDIFEWVSDEKDTWGNPLSPFERYFVQGVDADVQPLSGSRRAATSGTEYESTHRIFIFEPPVEEIPPGAKVRAYRDGKLFGHFEVVFPADWVEHLEIEVKRSGS